MKFIAGLFGGLVLAVLGTLLVTVTFAASPETGGSLGAIAFFVFWAVGFIIALTAKRASKSWRRLLITSSILAFLPPIAGIIYTGSFMATQVDTSSEFAGAEAVGAAIGGG